ncbi:MAG: DUF444 family protein [Candidatus Wallbacteria bacterium]|nr:DUF444 family protein [Candidatus Wallbacteria bacterium]
MYLDRGKLAQIEHDRKLREYLKKNLNVLVQRQKLVKDGKVKTNISVLDLPTLKYGKPEKEVLGSGSGQSGKGKQGKGGKDQGDGEPQEILDLSGTLGSDDHSESQLVELDFDEFVRLAQEQLIEELNLPPIGRAQITGDVEREEEQDLMDLDRPGSQADLNLELTMLESLGRSIRETGRPDYDVDLRHDGWYNTELPEEERTTRALEVYLLDISGSVSGHNIALIRKFIFILWYYLEHKYTTNVRKFVVFQDEAEEVQRDEFFSIESKGGTHISAGLGRAKAILEGHAQYDRYLFFFSDGDNSSSDDDAARKELDEVLEKFDLVCYGRINPCDSPVSPFNKLVREKVASVKNLAFSDIKDLENVKQTIQGFLNLISK